MRSGLHPYVIDTTVIYNMTGDRVRKLKLATLAKEFFGKEIQQAVTGHNLIEDHCQLQAHQTETGKQSLFW